MTEKLLAIVKTPVDAAAENRFQNLIIGCFECGSLKVKLVFKVNTSKIHSFLHCEDCQMLERISLSQFHHDQQDLF